jgi:hypothetical protein
VDLFEKKPFRVATTIPGGSADPRTAPTRPRWSLARARPHLLASTLLCVPWAPGCAREPAHGQAPDSPSRPWFVDRARDLGVQFTYQNGGTGKLYITEVVGAGVALFDCDGDGDLDLYLVNGSLDPEKGTATSGLVHRLYENRIRGPGAPGGFVDITEGSGLGISGYGMGVAVGDFDNDGDLDVLVTSLTGARLFRNDGHCHFEDISAEAGLDVAGWCTSAAFFDYDRDGFLDLYIARYLAFDPQIKCRTAGSRPDYCGPLSFQPVSDVLLHNEGGKRFTDVSEAAGIAALKSPGLGVVCADLDGDGWPDAYVANDGYPNHLWINRHDGTFHESAFQMGAAVNIFGHAEAGMGVVAADLDGDLTLDLFITHLDGESNILYLNRGPGRGFQDATGRSRTSVSSIPLTGFGVVALDADLDGDLDLLVANGRVNRGIPRQHSAAPPPLDELAEPKLFYLNDGNAQFTLATDLAGELGSSIEVSRGLAIGDIDGDGDLDVVVNNTGSLARIYFNEAPRAGHWLSVRAVDPRLHRDAIGAYVTVAAGGRRFLRCIEASSSYLSSSSLRAHFGLGRAESVESVEVLWPDGLRETFSVDGVDRAVELSRGEGRESK